MKPIKKPEDSFRRFDNPLLLVAAAWTAARPGDMPGQSREECILAALSAALVYVESVLRADGVKRERIAEITRAGSEVGEAIVDICVARQDLNIPPTVGVAGDIMVEMTERKLHG